MLSSPQQRLSRAPDKAHARRKFDEAIKILPKAKQQTGKGMVAINLIQKLYRLEKQMRE